jgi:hypothetical protein
MQATYLKSRRVATKQTSDKTGARLAALRAGPPLLLDRLQQNSPARCDRIKFVANETICDAFRSKKQSAFHVQATLSLPT